MGRELRGAELYRGQIVVLYKAGGNAAFTANVCDIHPKLGVLFATPRSRAFTGIVLSYAPDGRGFVDDSGAKITVHEYKEG
jgi:hypothetical protein